MQYTRRDWRNRNVIKTPSGLQWLTIPVQVKGKYLQLVDETQVADTNWSSKHVRSIELCYRKAAAFAEVAPWLFNLIVEAGEETLLSRLNERLLITIAQRLGIRTPTRRCTELLDRKTLIALILPRASSHYAKLQAPIVMFRGPLLALIWTRRCSPRPASRWFG